MMDKELKRNNEGYYDPTAYIALNNVQKGEYMNRTGEIWEVNTGDRYYRAIVVADDGNIATIIKLLDADTDNSDFCIRSKYGCSRMLMFAFTQNFVQFIRKLTDEEFHEVKSKVAISLGIHTKTVEKIVEVKPSEEDIQKLKEAIKKEQPQIMASDIELEKTKAQLSVYKSLYESLMQQLIGRGEGYGQEAVWHLGKCN